MLRRWARGLLAFLVCFALLQSGVLGVFATAKPAAGDPQQMQSAGMELQPGTLSTPKAIESAPNRLQQAAKRDQRSSGGPGDDAAALLFLLAVAAFLFPLPARSADIRVRPDPAPLRSRPQAAGRCPTGPPVPA